MIFGIIGGLVVFIFAWYMIRIIRFALNTNSGVQAMERGDFGAAERSFQKALQIAKRLPKEIGNHTLTAWLNLSMLSAKRGDSEEAIRRAASALRAMEGAKDSEQRFHLVFDHIAQLLEANGEFADAVQYRKYAVSSLPPEGPQTALSLLNLARSLQNAGRPQEATPLFESASRACTPRTAAEAANAAVAVQDMALALRRCGQHDEAERRFREAIRLFTETQGSYSLNVAIAWSNLGVLYVETGRHEQALTAYENSVRIRRKAFGDRSESVAVIENNRANCLREMRNLAQAEMAAKGALAIQRETKGKTLPSSLDTLGWIYLDCERYRDAEAAFSEACALLRARPDHDPEELSRFAERHALALEGLGRDEEAATVRAAAAQNASASRRALALILNQPAQESVKINPAKVQRIETPSGNATPLATQALLAVALTVGFYLVALGCMAMLTWFVWRIHSIYALVVDGLAILGILRAILPASARRNVLDSQLGKDRHPELFQAIESIARAVGEPMPSAVYLTPEPGAAVSEEGGFLAIGSRRILYIGYPTLLMLTVDEFRSVVAHEFGHYAGGDTKFARWIYPARAAVLRSFTSVRGAWGLVFEWYGKIFLRITQALSRQQEFNADKLAASITSPSVAASALRAHYSDLFDRFVTGDLGPVLRSGMLPPIAEGFAIFRAQRSSDENIEEPAASPYDSHPTLAARLKALQDLPQPPDADPDTDPAITLLNYREQMERWFANIVKPSQVSELQTVQWTECCTVFVDDMERETEKFKDLLQFIRFKEIPLILPAQASAAVQREYPMLPNPGAQAEFLIGRAAGLALLHEGWEGEGAPGDPLWFSNGQHSLNPSQMVKQLWAGELTDVEWRELAEETQVSDIPLLAPEPSHSSVN